MRMLILILAVNAMLVSCNRKQTVAQSKENIIQSGEATLIAEKVTPPLGDLQLTLDRETNVQRIKKLPGFEKLSQNEQQSLIKAILSTVPQIVIDTSKR